MMASKLRTVALIGSTALQGKSDAKGQYSRHKEFIVTSNTGYAHERDNRSMRSIIFRKKS